ncbi:ATP-binding protein [Pacificibacter marinus]|uniref:ATP-binding protein n=1 Tax=Pacificibacter marinus TaxID=658057 RepID=UPI001C0661CD|nr:ATP-binding protein [Pacificibacter marinus]MBU2867249.1 response regulator [Pacificibacter marinus]
MSSSDDTRVSRSRYNRECAARAEAEKLLERKSRELFEANTALNAHSQQLTEAVATRTAELVQALERAEAASVARSRFIATMSHEIRTPLGGLLGMIDLLEMDEVDAEKLELLNYAKAAGTGLSRIVNDVLDFSKMEAGVFVFEEENVDIRALAKSISMLYTSHGKGTARTITLQIDDSVPQLFLSDATRIRQVISNLISNALRYSTDGPIIVRATATPHAQGALLRCEVEDFGVGIPPEKFNDLFKDFSQVANPLTVAAQGTGLGLAICKRIMDGLGGRVGVESKQGAGSTFWIELAVTVVSASPSRPSQDSDAQSATPPPSITGKHVLIAEDNIINQKMLLAYAQRMDVSADMAENGRIAVEKFAPGKYDLILMDIAMPEMDGIEATRQIFAKWPKDSVPPILALTAHVADAIEAEAKEVGITRILSKPIPYDELKSALEATLGLTSNTASAQETPSPEDQTASVEDQLLAMMDTSVGENLLSIFSADGLIDLADKFVTDCNQRLDLLIAAAESGDIDAASKQGHSVKGACLAMGFESMAELAKRIEHHSSETSKATILEIAQELSDEIGQLNAILKS